MLSTKNTLRSERSSPLGSQTKIPSYTDDDLDRFQRELNREKIMEIWREMRAGGNSKDGIVTKEKFRQIFSEHFRDIKIKESLMNDIFERFKKKDLARDERNDKRRNDEKRNIGGDADKGEIDLHDLVVSLAIVSTMHYDDKLELVFDLTDIDEDGCLSPDDICKMILAIERNFAKECSIIDSENGSSQYNVATKKALRRFNYIFLYEGQEEPQGNTNGVKARKDKLLGHFKDFMEKLDNKQSLYKNLLPKHYSLRRVLANRTKEISFKIHKNDEDQFKKFRSELHGRLWGGTPVEANKIKSPTAKKEEFFKFQHREPGEVASYGIRTIEEEPKSIENVQEGLKQKEFITQERISQPNEHTARLKEMREKSYPNLNEIITTKYETSLKKKETYLPQLGKFPSRQEIQLSNIQTPDLTSLIEKRVDRLKKQYKYLDVNYKDYLVKKLTSSITERGHISEVKPTSTPRKIQAYKFLL